MACNTYTIELSSLAHIDNARISLGDLTVFIGPQASGKSLVAQAWKLFLDAAFIQSHLEEYGYYWGNRPEDFLQLYFGRGYEEIWRSDTRLSINGNEVLLQNLLTYKRKAPREQVFYIPAQRVLSLIYGYDWPLPFKDFETATPYVLAQYSNETRRYLDWEFPEDNNVIFPSKQHLPEDLREQIAQHIYPGVRLIVEHGWKKRLVLEIQETKTRLSIRSWAAGQREFTPLMLGLYQLLPAGKLFKRKYDWVVIEEPEMGLHAQAVGVVIQAVFHLLFRGYRVILTTHTETVVEQAQRTALHWQNIITEHSRKALGAHIQNRRLRLDEIADLHKEIKTYLFYLSGGRVSVAEMVN